MDSETFRAHAHAFVDWMADYLANIERRPVRAQVQPGDISRLLAAEPPVHGEAIADIFAAFERDILPGVTHWQHPRFFAYFPANASPPSVLAEMLTAILGVNCMAWETSPAGTELETRVLAWLRQMVGLPEGFEGVIQDSASSATLVALLAACERATAGAAGARGLAANRALTVYASAETHSSIDKGMMVAGLGLENLRKIPTDSKFALRPEVLADAVRRDRHAGLLPACVVATLGTTAVGGIDPLADIAEIARREGLYLHVDAAWAGSALVCEEFRDMLAGISEVDSFVFNPHKWLLTNFDCSAHFVRDMEEVERALTVSPAYLRTAAGDRVVDYRNRSVPLGRRFRALKLWFVIRHYGVAGLQAHVRRHVGLAQGLEARIRNTPGFVLAAPRSLSLVTFRYRPDDAPNADALDQVNRELLARVNEGGLAYLSPCEIQGRFALRLAIGAPGTQERHVIEVWNHITRLAAQCNSAVPSPGPAGT